MSDAVNALLDAAPDGVDFDGLVVESSAYGYTFSTPERSERGLSTPEFHEVAAGDPYVENWHFWTHDAPGDTDSPRRAFLRWVEHVDEGLGDSPDAEVEGLGDSPDAEVEGLGDASDAESEGLGDASDAESEGLGDASDAESEGLGDASDAEVEGLGDSPDAGSGLDPVERAAALDGDGLSREWGEIRIRARREGGTHVYDVRHVDDTGESAEDLDVYDDPLDARGVVKHDDEGGYRPLKSAPTLPHGWVYPSLDPDELVETVEFVYPASIANWHRERAGDLDVTHWAETAGRQSGIYEVVQELPRDALEWAAEACCTDGACVKRREWDADEGDDLDVPRGDGDFPCREPCSLFVTAARKFTTLEREEEREYTFTLTPTEKEQVEGLVDAVADDTVADVRPADLNEDANQYRARYLRAKRHTDRGLSDEPTYD